MHFKNAIKTTLKQLFIFALILSTLQVDPIYAGTSGIIKLSKPDVENSISMAVLHNRISNKELKKRLMEETESRVTISFYRYCPIQNPKEFRDHLYKHLNNLKVFGRIYVAKEGINAQISIPQPNFEA